MTDRAPGGPGTWYPSTRSGDRGLGPGGLRQLGVAAAEVEQRRLVVAGVGVLHLADEDGVVARLVGRDQAALEAGEGLREDGDAALADAVRRLAELVGGARGEAARDLL